MKVNVGLKILVEEALVPFETALDAVSLNPMRYLKMDDHKGRIKTGFDADIVVLNDDYFKAHSNNKKCNTRII